MDKKGVYIHIPFCKSICSYCDFCKVVYKKEWVKDYLKKLYLEIKDIYMGEEIDTIYIGGGTPSLLNIEELNVLFKIIECFNISDNLEFSFECNLNDINIDLLSFLKEHNVNRLSIGIETFNEDIQILINRDHSFEDALEKINLCREMGFDNINLDLIYGFREQNLKDVKKDLKLFMKLKPNHISTYSLILEENSILKYKKYEIIDEEKEFEMYEYICKYLKKNKFIHYEISNFSLPGYQSKHNLKYWNNEEYYGFGLGASGYIEGVRYTNTRSMKDYLENDEISTKELLTKQDIMDNEIMLGMRKIDGINIDEFNSKYNVKMDEIYPINALLKNGDLVKKKDNIMINPDKMYIMNEILIKMI